MCLERMQHRMAAHCRHRAAARLDQEGRVGARADGDAARRDAVGARRCLLIQICCSGHGWSACHIAWPYTTHAGLQRASAARGVWRLRRWGCRTARCGGHTGSYGMEYPPISSGSESLYQHGAARHRCGAAARPDVAGRRPPAWLRPAAGIPNLRVRSLSGTGQYREYLRQAGEKI